jgi:hypothetical protein
MIINTYRFVQQNTAHKVIEHLSYFRMAKDVFFMRFNQVIFSVTEISEHFVIEVTYVHVIVFALIHFIQIFYIII